jgi:hypothetical protein
VASRAHAIALRIDTGRITPKTKGLDHANRTRHFPGIVVLLCAACAAVPPGGGSTGARSPQAVADELLAADRNWRQAPRPISDASAMFRRRRNVGSRREDVGEPTEAIRHCTMRQRAIARRWAPVRVGVGGTQGYTWAT